MIHRAKLCAWLLLIALSFDRPFVRAAEPEQKPDVKAALAEARHLYLTGKYAEAQEQYAKLKDKDPVAAILGEVRCRSATGKGLDALAGEGITAHTNGATLWSEGALLLLSIGRDAEAEVLAKRLLRTDGNNYAARWVQAELFRQRGKIKEANDAYKWFVDQYNAKEITDPDTLRIIGKAAAQYARWNRLSDQFTFLVNDLFPDIVKADKDYWPAHYEAGLLYLEKYNEAEASREFKKALAINPNSADVHAAMAVLALQTYDLKAAQASIDRAKGINKELFWADLLQADVHLSNFDPPSAIKLLTSILFAGEHLLSSDEEALGRLAASLIARDGLPERLEGEAFDGTELGKLFAIVHKQNPHCGEFYNALGDGLDKLRRYPDAARFYREAIVRMPQLTAPRGQLGLIQMRLGDEAVAEKTLRESFEIDPFNVRVSNSLKVLEVLSGYATLETEHFVIKYDRAKDEVLARFAAQYLEDEVYPALCKKLGYEPKEKSLFEFFSRARNTDGHGWFSARMVGLPYIGTVGACAGKMVAMASPNDMQQKFNWARVLKHEFVHVVNLQQTNFNIPHWFTEALAVLNEEYPRQKVWDELLVERVPTGKIFNLDTINGGFIRPKNSLEWQLAYCQAELYAEYMLARFGEDALAKMLTAYGKNLTTPQAIERAFEIKQDDFEQGYVEHLNKVVAEIGRGNASDVASEQEATLEELQHQHQAKPDDADIAAALADKHFAAKQFSRARGLVDAVLKQQPKHQLATLVLVRLKSRAGETDKIQEMLEACLDRDKPDHKVLSMLAEMHLDDKQYDKAATLYELGARKYPTDKQWTQALARVYLKSGNDAKLAPLLEQLATADADVWPVRKKLAQLALARKDFPQAERWSREALFIDVMDAEMFRTLAMAHTAQDEHKQAVGALELAKLIKPDDAELRIELAGAYLANGQPAKARDEIAAVLKQSPDFKPALELQKKLKP